MVKLKDSTNELVEEYLQVRCSVATLSDRCANLRPTQFFGYTKARHCFQAERRAKRLTLSAPEADDDGGQWQTFSTTQVRATCYAPCGSSGADLAVLWIQKALLRAFDEGARTQFMETWAARIPDTVFRVRVQ